MARAKSRPGVFISSSSQGIYGFDRVTDTTVDEDAPIGADDWAEDSKCWEDEALKADGKQALQQPSRGFLHLAELLGLQAV